MDIAIRKILPVPEGTLIVVDENGNFVPSYVREMELLAVTGPATESITDETTTSPTESVTDNATTSRPEIVTYDELTNQTKSVTDETTTSPTESVTDNATTSPIESVIDDATTTNALKRKIEEQAEMIQNKDKDISDLKNKMKKMESTVKLLVEEIEIQGRRKQLAYSAAKKRCSSPPSLDTSTTSTESVNDEMPSSSKTKIQKPTRQQPTRQQPTRQQPPRRTKNN